MDSSQDPSEPHVSFVVGQGRVVPGLDRGLVGVAVGETWSAVLDPADAFGVRDAGSVVAVPRKQGDSVAAEPGSTVQLTDGRLGRITAVTAESVTIDLNHPLAERRVAFEVKVLSVEEEPRNRLSGLHVEVLKAGDGKSFPVRGSKVTVHYTGTLAADGKEFDSSRRRGQPFSFVIGQHMVIQGWELGLAKFSLGQRANLYVPAELGYGSRGVGPIPPNADLVFDVELLKIE